MRLRALIETVLPTLVDDLPGYDKYELSLVALKGDEPVAQSIICIKRNQEDYTTTYTEVQRFEAPPQETL
jgi:hypothetical protein